MPVAGWRAVLGCTRTDSISWCYCRTKLLCGFQSLGHSWESWEKIHLVYKRLHKALGKPSLTFFSFLQRLVSASFASPPSTASVAASLSASVNFSAVRMQKQMECYGLVLLLFVFIWVPKSNRDLHIQTLRVPGPSWLQLVNKVAGS